MPNRLFTPRDRDTRYSQYILNYNEGFEVGHSSLVMSFAFEQKISEKDAKALIKQHPQKLDDLL